MDVDKKLKLIKRNTAEIITESELKELLKKKKNPAVYLGTAITGKPHIGYFVWVKKMDDFIKAGFKVKVLLADFHGALDNCPWELLEKRLDYYKIVIKALFESIGSDLSKVETVIGSSFQKKEDYLFDVLKMSTYASLHDCKKAASDVVKFGDSPKLSGFIYPIMQALDEHYLNVDIQYGGMDQRKILVFARENNPKLNYKSRVEILSPLVPGLTASGKMSSSDKASKIDLSDDEKTVKSKLKKAYCPEGQIEDNGVLAFLKYVIFPLKEDNNKKLIITRLEKFGGNKEYQTYTEFEKDYKNKQIHPLDVKNTLEKEVNILLNPIRKKLKNKEKLIKQAYPDS